MKNQIQTAIELRDRATQVALNFVGHRISSSDGSYSLLKDCIFDALNQAFIDGAAHQVAITAEAEREECLKIVGRQFDSYTWDGYKASECFSAAIRAIRARSEK